MNQPLVFFGSGPVAAESLRLLAQDFTIEAVITKPQPPHHKEPFPVLTLANELNLPVFTPNSRTELSVLFTTKPVKSQLGVVIDYGFIINQDVIDYFPFGIINSHFSLLPQWRGADPITFSILSGQTKTGVSLMLISAGMDEGPILAQGECDISNDATTPNLTSSLIQLSHSLLKGNLAKYIASEIKLVPQEEVAKLMNTPTQPSYSRKLTKQDGTIDWAKPAEVIEREIRAFIEWPRSRTAIAGKDVVITKAKVIPRTGKPGIVTIDNKNMYIACGEQSLEILVLKPAGKNEMTSEAFLAGHKHLLT